MTQGQRRRSRQVCQIGRSICATKGRSVTSK